MMSKDFAAASAAWRGAAILPVSRDHALKSIIKPTLTSDCRRGRRASKLLHWEGRGEGGGGAGEL